jgi:hypothetical protein
MDPRKKARDLRAAAGQKKQGGATLPSHVHCTVTGCLVATRATTPASSTAPKRSHPTHTLD